MKEVIKNKKKLCLMISTIILLVGGITLTSIHYTSKNKTPSINIDERENENNNEQTPDENMKTEETKEESQEELDKKESLENKNENHPEDSKENKNQTNNNPVNDDNNHNSSENQEQNTEIPSTPTDTPSTKPSPTPTPSPTPSPTPTPTDKNNEKRKQIENTYHVKILYGNEIGSYTPRGITPTRLTDDAEIENYLNKINIELAKYPTGFFQDFNKKGMPLTIYLIKSANGAFAGFTDYQFMNDIKLTVATNYEFEYTLNHELMHYIDCYLNIVMYPNTPYQEYETLNPINFTYPNAKEEQIYNMGNNQRGAYFISTYGASSVQEDRAEVFKFMMTRAYAPIGCFEEGETIRKKAQVISNQIKTYFPSVNKTTHWDRFIK